MKSKLLLLLLCMVPTLAISAQSDGLLILSPRSESRCRYVDARMNESGDITIRVRGERCFDSTENQILMARIKVLETRIQNAIALLKDNIE